MYLEERLEQIEQVVVDHGRQLETVANGLAELTVDVRAIRQDMTDGFRRVDEQFVEVNKRLGALEETQQEMLQIQNGMLQTQREMQQAQTEMGKRFNEMQQTQQLILKVITERL